MTTWLLAGVAIVWSVVIAESGKSAIPASNPLDGVYGARSNILDYDTGRRNNWRVTIRGKRQQPQEKVAAHLPQSARVMASVAAAPLDDGRLLPRARNHGVGVGVAVGTRGSHKFGPRLRRDIDSKAQPKQETTAETPKADKSKQQSADYWGAIRNTAEQKYGKKVADKIKELNSEADNSLMIAAYAKVLRKVLERKEVRESFLMLVPADVLSAEAEKQKTNASTSSASSSGPGPDKASSTKAPKSKGGEGDDEEEEVLPPGA